MCRRQTLTPLSPAERSVAEQHYRLVEWYVRHRGLPVDEYLDVAVFGYLLAVKRWFARPDLYRYEFTTIACAAMRSAIGNEQRKQSRRIKTVSLDDPIPGTDGHDLGRHHHRGPSCVLGIGGISVKITYNLQVLPQRKNSRKDSEETTALKAFLADSEKKNMVFEYDTPQEAKKRYDSMRNYRNANKLQDIYDMWRSDALICIVKTKKGAAKK